MNSFDDVNSIRAFKITKLSDGGFVVGAMREYDDAARNVPLFASSKIGEALEYIREKLSEERAAPGVGR